MLTLCSCVFFFFLGNSTLTRSNFEMTASCSDDYLVEGKDFLTFEFEANVNDSSYFSNVLLNGPKFYSTWTRNSYSISVSFILLLVNISFHIYSFHLFLFRMCLSLLLILCHLFSDDFSILIYMNFKNDIKDLQNNLLWY